MPLQSTILMQKVDNCYRFLFKRKKIVGIILIDKLWDDYVFIVANFLPFLNIQELLS